MTALRKSPPGGPSESHWKAAEGIKNVKLIILNLQVNYLEFISIFFIFVCNFFYVFFIFIFIALDAVYKARRPINTNDCRQ